MAAIDTRLDLAIRELRGLCNVPGDWRRHAGRIVDRCRQFLRSRGQIRAAVALLPYCDLVDPEEAAAAIEGVAARMREERQRTRSPNAS